MDNKKAIIFLLLILLLAAVFRLWRLDSIPSGLYPDVAINGNDALDSLETGNFKVFYPENNGREGLFIWLIALSFSIFGPSIWAIKIVAAVFGILTVLGVYLLTKELFKSINHQSPGIIALLSSFFLAISFWHTNFSRIGFRAIMVPFFLVFGFYLLFRGFNKKQLYNFIISGIFFGFGFYTYISYRFVVFILAIVLLCWWFIYKKLDYEKQFLKFTVYCLLSAFIVALPIGIYFLKNPSDFVGRSGQVSIFSQPNPIYAFGKSLLINLQMFNFYGDVNWRHNFAGSPQLLWPIGIFFLIGIILSIKESVNSFKGKNRLKFTVYILLLSWFFFMLLSGVLTYEGIPHSLRVIGVIPAVYIFSGLGAFWLFEKSKKFYKTKNQKIAFGLIIAVFLLAITYSEFDKYFYQWGKNPEVKNAFSENYLKIGNYLNSLPDNIQKYVIVNQGGVPVPWPNGIPMPAQTPIFIERAMFGQSRSTYILPEDLDKIEIKKDTIFTILHYDEALFSKINYLFLWGKFEEQDGFWTYKIKNIKSCSKCGQ